MSMCELLNTMALWANPSTHKNSLKTNFLLEMITFPENNQNLLQETGQIKIQYLYFFFFWFEITLF
jgi:hypothetical protein